MHSELRLQEELAAAGLHTTLTKNYDESDFVIGPKTRMEMKVRQKSFWQYDSEFIPANKLNFLKRNTDNYDTFYLTINADGMYGFWVSDIEPYEYRILFNNMKTPAYALPLHIFRAVASVEELAQILRERDGI